MAKIIIIEDDSLLRSLYEDIFKFDGYEVAVAADGEEGLEVVREFRPTLILLDIMMPKMNGLEVLKKIKSDPETKNIPVIILTNLAGETDAKTALTLGAVKYIVKSSYNPKEISEMVKEILAAYTRNELPKMSSAKRA